MTLKDYSQLKFQVEVFNHFYHPICLTLSKSLKDDDIVADLSFVHSEGLQAISSCENIKDAMNSLSHFTKVMKAVEYFNKVHGSLILDKIKEKPSNKYNDIHRNSDDWWDQS